MGPLSKPPPPPGSAEVDIYSTEIGEQRRVMLVVREARPDGTLTVAEISLSREQTEDLAVVLLDAANAKVH